MTTINILKDFTSTPGARFKDDGPFSGEEFRERFLEPHFNDPRDDSQIEIIFDGTEGYATSFLEEAFGGLARKFSVERCLRKLKLTSTDDRLIIDEVISYIERANETK